MKTHASTLLFVCRVGMTGQTPLSEMMTKRIICTSVLYERSEFYIVIGAGIVEEIEAKAEYMGGLADRILRCR